MVEMAMEAGGDGGDGGAVVKVKARGTAPLLGQVLGKLIGFC